ncbi:MAG: Blr2286 protein [uncultured Sulfurovum sp.]|uniref:Blr2286 protein n=1 Tax=uncultured Sulfurovum sp. TaxID=269237 RepID=A0A6S6TVT7_9BACT|nr:MAG: Blr2286 protein [uncultured Sulfurovum sp.]
MKLNQYIYISNDWDKRLDLTLDSDNTLVLVFSSLDNPSLQAPLQKLIKAFPQSKFMGCSTAGEMYGNTLAEEHLVVQVIKFEKTILKLVHTKIKDSDYSYMAGETLSLALGEPKAVIVLSDGLNVNGSQLTKAFSATLGKKVMVSGGLAGDDGRFESTWVLIDKEPKSHYIGAVGFYGDEFYFGYGSEGGWSSLGLKRKVTSSCANILYELDNQPALSLYKHYLGERANGLPSTGLLFPLGLYSDDEIKVRSILSVDEEEQSITFAGDIPEGSTVSLMKSSFKSLTDAAVTAVENINFERATCEKYCCIAISCVGRKLVLGQRVEDEIEAVFSAFPSLDVMQIGYYSYGEISPSSIDQCDLYNQTMTVVLLGEY